MAKDALSTALHFLKFRPRTEFEVRRKLSTKCQENEIVKVISVLKKNKLLNDQEFAKMWVRDRNLLRPCGSYLLKLELRKLGISESDIETALKKQDEEDLARKALELKYREREIDFDKKAALLARRGFSTSIIYKILKK